MRLVLVITLLAALGAGPALAETRPVPLPADPRIRTYLYNPNTVYQLDTHTHYISTIEFEPGEIVESIQIGDSVSWEVVRLNRGDVLSVKALIEGAFTNMTVYTDQRRYTFDLNARRGRANEWDLNYRVQFVYPQTVIDFVSREEIERDRRPRREGYHTAGVAPFAPVAVWDNGIQTTFTLPDDVPTPAIFRVDPTGRETIVNVRQSGQDLIVDSISDRWTLRAGDVELCVAHGAVIDTVPTEPGAYVPRRPGSSRWDDDR